MKRVLKWVYPSIMGILTFVIIMSFYIIFTPMKVLSYLPYSEFDVEYNKETNTLESTIEFCKFEPIPTTIERQLIGYTEQGEKYERSFRDTVNADVGCYTDYQLHISLPADIPNGTYYVVNPIEYQRFIYSIKSVRQSQLFVVDRT